jgi:hypothetical protein
MVEESATSSWFSVVRVCPYHSSGSSSSALVVSFFAFFCSLVGSAFLAEAIVQYSCFLWNPRIFCSAPWSSSGKQLLSGEVRLDSKVCAVVTTWFLISLTALQSDPHELSTPYLQTCTVNDLSRTGFNGDTKANKHSCICRYAGSHAI